MGKGGGGGFGGGLGDTLAGGFRNDVFGTSKQAAHAQNAALQQQAEAQAQRREAMDFADRTSKSLADMAKASPAEMAAYERSLGAADAQLAQSERLMQSIDPALMEASKQVLGLLRGEQSGIGNAIGNQRAAQRQQLVDSLRAQYGPGAESTSIGQRALRAFDTESTTLGAQAQQSGLATLMGVMQNRPNLDNALQGLNSAGNNFMNLRNQQLQAGQFGGQLGMQARLGTGQQVIDMAGADQTGALIKTGAQRAFWDNWSQSSMRFGESFGGAGMTKKGGGGQAGGKAGAGGVGGAGNAGASGGYQLSNAGTTDSNFWASNPYK